ncbi:hypothetical protein OF846_002369 [Rhodotorula toruloides]|nr:hypothetical protein OF846_002369 [Rhodotorula toruloides]
MKKSGRDARDTTSITAEQDLLPSSRASRPSTATVAHASVRLPAQTRRSTQAQGQQQQRSRRQEEEEKVEHEQEGSPGGRGGLVGRRRERGERERRGWRVVERCGGLFDGCGQDGGSEAVRGGPAQAAPREGCEGCCQVAQGARRRVQREAREHVGALRHPQGRTRLDWTSHPSLRNASAFNVPLCAHLACSPAWPNASHRPFATHTSPQASSPRNRPP